MALKDEELSRVKDIEDIVYDEHAAMMERIYDKVLRDDDNERMDRMMRVGVSYTALSLMMARVMRIHGAEKAGGSIIRLLSGLTRELFPELDIRTIMPEEYRQVIDNIHELAREIENPVDDGQEKPH